MTWRKISQRHDPFPEQCRAGDLSSRWADSSSSAPGGKRGSNMVEGCAYGSYIVGAWMFLPDWLISHAIPTI